MDIIKDVAYKIWHIREELGLPGSQSNDWKLSGLFLDQHDGRYSEDDVYSWYMQLDNKTRNGGYSEENEW